MRTQAQVRTVLVSMPPRRPAGCGPASPQRCQVRLSAQGPLTAWPGKASGPPAPTSLRPRLPSSPEGLSRPGDRAFVCGSAPALELTWTMKARLHESHPKKDPPSCGPQGTRAPHTCLQPAAEGTSAHVREVFSSALGFYLVGRFWGVCPASLQPPPCAPGAAVLVGTPAVPRELRPPPPALGSFCRGWVVGVGVIRASGVKPLPAPTGPSAPTVRPSLPSGHTPELPALSLYPEA